LRNECGEELVEVALSIAVLIGIIFGLIEVCLAFYSAAYIAEVAREGSRYAAFHGANCTNSYTGASCTVTALQIGTYVTSLSLPNLGGGAVSVDTTPADIFPDGDQVSPHRVVVKATYSFPYKIPFVSSSTLSISSTSTMTIIQ
jgi:Flp pilus assembly protein TadG